MLFFQTDAPPLISGRWRLLSFRVSCPKTGTFFYPYPFLGETFAKQQVNLHGIFQPDLSKLFSQVHRTFLQFAAVLAWPWQFFCLPGSEISGSDWTTDVSHRIWIRIKKGTGFGAGNAKG